MVYAHINTCVVKRKKGLVKEWGKLSILYEGYSILTMLLFQVGVEIIVLKHMQIKPGDCSAVN